MGWAGGRVCLNGVGVADNLRTCCGWHDCSRSPLGGSGAITIRDAAPPSPPPQNTHTQLLPAMGGCLISGISGCFYNVVGFPITAFGKALVEELAAGGRLHEFVDGAGHETI